MLSLLGLSPGPDDLRLPLRAWPACPAPTATAAPGRTCRCQSRRPRRHGPDMPCMTCASTCIPTEQIQRTRPAKPSGARQLPVWTVDVHTGCAAGSLLNPGRAPLALPPDRPRHGSRTSGQLCSRRCRRFEAEHRVLITALGHALTAGHNFRAWNIAWTLLDYLSYRGHWLDQLEVSASALAAAARLGDPALQAKCALLPRSGCSRGRPLPRRADLIPARPGPLPAAR